EDEDGVIQKPRCKEKLADEERQDEEEDDVVGVIQKPRCKKKLADEESEDEEEEVVKNKPLGENAQPPAADEIESETTAHSKAKST
ncbi:unnamed protein product, partial [Amoebophrya sp. A120]